MFCSNCGKEIAEGMSFCQYCGKPVSVPKTSGSFLRSIQEKAKSVNESVTAAAGEAQKKTGEKKAQDENASKQQASSEPLEKRFKIQSFSKGLLSESGAVIVDTLTGVNYLFIKSSGGGCGGLTILVDKDGKPLVSEEPVNKADV